MDEEADQRGGVIAFRAPAELIASTEALAAQEEGIVGPMLFGVRCFETSHVRARGRSPMIADAPGLLQLLAGPQMPAAKPMNLLNLLLAYRGKQRVGTTGTCLSARAAHRQLSPLLPHLARSIAPAAGNGAT